MASKPKTAPKETVICKEIRAYDDGSFIIYENFGHRTHCENMAKLLATLTSMVNVLAPRFNCKCVELDSGPGVVWLEYLEERLARRYRPATGEVQKRRPAMSPRISLPRDIRKPLPESGRPIRHLRGVLEASQDQFSRLLGVHWVTVSKWERGLGRPTEWQATIMHVARANLLEPGRLELAKHCIRSGLLPQALGVLLSPTDTKFAPPPDGAK